MKSHELGVRTQMLWLGSFGHLMQCASRSPMFAIVFTVICPCLLPILRMAGIHTTLPRRLLYFLLVQRFLGTRPSHARHHQPMPALCRLQISTHAIPACILPIANINPCHTSLHHADCKHQPMPCHAMPLALNRTLTLTLTLIQSMRLRSVPQTLLSDPSQAACARYKYFALSFWQKRHDSSLTTTLRLSPWGLALQRCQ